MFLQPGQHLGQDEVVVVLEALQLGEPGDEEPCGGGGGTLSTVLERGSHTLRIQYSGTIVSSVTFTLRERERERERERDVLQATSCYMLRAVGLPCYVR